MSTKDLVEEIETYIMTQHVANESVTARDIVAFFDGRETQYSVIAALRGMRDEGTLTEIKGKLYLQRGFGG